MNWEQAQKALHSGQQVRRPDWDTSLVKRDGKIQWDISDELARSYGTGKKADKAYTPHKTDVAAEDWVRA